MTSKHIAGLAAFILLSVGGTAQAKNHLSRDELKILSSTSVAVVYIDTTTPIQPFIKNNGGAAMGGFAGAMISDAVTEHEMNEFNARISPYQAVISNLMLPQSTYKAAQDALASVAFLHEAPWISAVPDPKDNLFMREQGLKTKANVVIFIRPRLEMNDDADGLYMVTMIDIETLDATGKTLNHYENSEFELEADMDDDKLPPLTTRLPAGTEDEDVRAAKLFANGGAAFKQFYAQLLQQAQQKLYYFFTGNDTPPPSAATATAATK